jgi:hypothetical protein
VWRRLNWPRTAALGLLALLGLLAPHVSRLILGCCAAAVVVLVAVADHAGWGAGEPAADGADAADGPDDDGAEPLELGS